MAIGVLAMTRKKQTLPYTGLLECLDLRKNGLTALTVNKKTGLFDQVGTNHL